MSLPRFLHFWLGFGQEERGEKEEEKEREREGGREARAARGSGIYQLVREVSRRGVSRCACEPY